MSKMIRVGFSRRDITPEEYTTMGGFGNDAERTTTVILDRLYGTCVAIQGGEGQPVILCSVDIINSHRSTVTDGIREAVTAATGIPAQRIMVAATHNHAGPSLYNRSDPRTDRFLNHLTQQMAKAATDAIADLSEAQIRIGQKTATQMTFDRHYFTNDGMPYGTGLGSLASGLKCHMDEADEQMQLIRFKRQDARDILLVNWQSHVTFVGGIMTDTQMSADYVGAMRNHLEGMTGCHVAFFQGACGNLVPRSRIEEENLVEKKDFMTYGKKLAELALSFADDLRPVNGGAIQMKQLLYKAKIDHSDDHRVPAAEEALTLYNAAAGLPPKERKQIMLDRGFKSRSDAASVINRFQAGEAMEMELNVISAGDISFVTAPYEMFCSNGKFIKDNTPFPITFVMGYCNGNFSYLADKKGFQYDTYERRCRRFPEGTAEDIAQTYVKTLEELKQQ